MSEPIMEHQVRINYRSGNSFIGWFTKFDIKETDFKVSSIDADHSDGQRLMSIGILDIESIIRISSRVKATQTQ